MRPSTETLKEQLQELYKKYNEALQVQNQCKDQIIAVQAVIADREDGDTETDTTSSSEV